MHPYRTHTCGELNKENINQTVRLSGWVDRKRDHGNLVFIDLRDHYGITQCVAQIESPLFNTISKCRNEDIITISGKIVGREPNTVNSKMTTGAIELLIEEIILQFQAPNFLPLQVNSSAEFPEETRLTYRYLDLRREKQHKKIILRSKIISSLRKRMLEQGFMEFQTPILTSSSPEGARDFLVPSRLHPGQFYALPQAPQQFKQLLMVSGFDRYFQIAPCFRDEDARADRSPGEFYQLDFEMSFVTQEDVFAAIEPVLSGVFKEFCDKDFITEPPYPRIPYAEALLKYGSDKPDLRNPLIIYDVTNVFKDSSFSIFANAIEKGAVVRAIPVPNCIGHSRSFFDKLNSWAQDNGLPGLGYILFEGDAAKGPIAKFLDDTRLQMLKKCTSADNNYGIFFVCDKISKACENAGLIRNHLANEFNLIEQNSYRFCWVVDFPLYEFNEQTNKIDFSHNPFSMPQGGMKSLETLNPLEIKAHQYDIVCNGIELSSGAIRNHLPEIMYKAFEIAGYPAEEVERKFGGLLNAFKFGAPPHGGCAPGIDRIVMLIAKEPNIREIIAFPMNQQAQDLLMGAPSNVSVEQLRDLNIEVKPPKIKQIKTENSISS